jgi:ABC-type amino acid transport substrate-binding protein
MASALTADTEVVVVGIDGSPSSGVGFVASAPGWRGEPGRSDALMVAPGRGVWIEELETEIRVRGLRTPRIVGVGMDLPGATPESLGQDLVDGLSL